MIRLFNKYWLIVRVAFVLIRIRLVLRVWSLPRVLAWLTPVGLTGAHDDAATDDLVYYIDRWLAILPYNRKGNCFPRSLALYRFAWRSGAPVQFHCGVRMGYLDLEGHAWVTLNGEPFHEMTQQWSTYTVTYSYPPEAPKGYVTDAGAVGRSGHTNAS